MTGDAGGFTAPRATRLVSSTPPSTRCGFWLPVLPFRAVMGTRGAGNQRQSKQGARGGLAAKHRRGQSSPAVLPSLLQ